MIDAKTVEELRGLLAADTSTDWQTVRSDPAEGADVWWICAKNAAGQEVELGSLQGGWPHPTREARARLIVAMRNALPALLDLTASLAREGEDGDSLANQVVREVAELPDRTSPDDMPDMLMVTAQELHDIVDAADSTRTKSSESLVAELREKVERLRKALLRLQNGAAVALNVIPEDQQEGVVGNFLAAIHRECCAGLSAGQGADECEDSTP